MPVVGGFDRVVESYEVSEVTPRLESMVEPVVESPLNIPDVEPVFDGVVGIIVEPVEVVVPLADPVRSTLFFELDMANAFTETKSVAHK